MLVRTFLFRAFLVRTTVRAFLVRSTVRAAVRSFLVRAFLVRSTAMFGRFRFGTFGRFRRLGTVFGRSFGAFLGGLG
jgi:hypothetical protein